MKESDTNRIIIYSVLLLLVLLLCISSYYLYFNGYGSDGKVRKEVSPIVDIFNSLKAVEDNPNYLKAKLTNDGISIKYIVGKNESNYNIIYKEVNDLKLFEFKYDISDYGNGEYIGKLLLDATSVYHKNTEGKIFESLKYSDLYELNTNIGANLSQRGNTVILVININTNMTENLKDTGILDAFVKYITIVDLNEMTDKINKDKHYSYFKGNIILDIYSQDDKYIIYCSNFEEDYNVIFESVMSAIKILDSNRYEEIINLNLNYTQNFKNDIINLEINPKLNDNTLASGNYLMKMTVIK